MQKLFRLALVIPFISAAPAVADQAWTMADLDAVAGAAMEAIVDSKSTGAIQLVKLADALISARNNERAKLVLFKASSLLSSPANSWDAHILGDIIERFAQLGNVAEAEALAAIDAQPRDKAMLLGKFGKGRARAGDVEAALKAAKAIALIAELNEAANAVATAAQTSLTEIGIALSDYGAPDDALHLAEGLSDGLQKLRVLAQVANAFCPAENRKTNGRPLSQDISDRTAKAVRFALTTADNPFQRVALLQTAAEAIALCGGAGPAKTLVGESAASDTAVRVLSKLSDKFTDLGKIELAREIAPTTDPTNVDQLLDAARRSLKQGDRAAAVRDALAASRLALAVPRDPASPWHELNELSQLSGRISGLLLELDEIDAAIATLQLAQISDRKQYYLSMVRTEVQSRNGAAIARALPEAIATMKLPSLASSMSNPLYDLTRVLAAGGYANEARKSFETLMEVSNQTC
jgi:tetratricopeptide (TPR) repeat protein